MIGVAIFRHRIGYSSMRATLTCIAIFTLCAWMANGFAIAIASILTALAIMFVTVENRVLTWLGAISYSLYLTHEIVIGRVLTYGIRVSPWAWSKLALLGAAFAACIAAAYCFYRIIEKPSQGWSARFKYKKTGRVIPEQPAREPAYFEETSAVTPS